MSEVFAPISEDGRRLVTGAPPQYSLYVLDGPLDPQATSRRYHWCGFVPEFRYVEQWLATGDVRGETVEIEVVPTPVEKRTRGKN